jgi:hypothetical protein
MKLEKIEVEKVKVEESLDEEEIKFLETERPNIKQNAIINTKIKQ